MDLPLQGQVLEAGHQICERKNLDGSIDEIIRVDASFRRKNLPDDYDYERCNVLDEGFKREILSKGQELVLNMSLFTYQTLLNCKDNEDIFQP